MRATPETLVPLARLAPPFPTRSEEPRRAHIASRARGRVTAVAVVVLGSVLVAGCKSSPYGDGRADKKSPAASEGASERGGATGSASGGEAPAAELEAKLVRVDALVREWDVKQGAGRDAEAAAIAAKIGDEVDRDFALFETSSTGAKGVRAQNLAVEALAFSRNRAATKLLVDRLQDLDASVVGNALIGLKIRSDPDTPLVPIVRLVRASYPEARRYAPLALANVVRAKEAANRPIEPDLSDLAMAGLVSLVQDGDPYARLHAAKAMGALRRSDATDFLVMLLNDERATIRIAAAAALERIGDPRSFPSVIELLDKVPADQKSIVREILVSFAERLQKRPMTEVEKRALDVSPRAWDRWFSSRDTAPAAKKSG